MLCRVEVLCEKVLTETVLAGKAQIKRFHLRLSADAYYNQRNTWRNEYKDITTFIKGSLLKRVVNSPTSGDCVLKPSLMEGNKPILSVQSIV